MNALVQTKLSKHMFRDMAHMGKRLRAGEALSTGVVDKVAPAAQVLTASLNLAESLADKGVNRSTLKALKEEGYADALQKLRLQGTDALGWGARVGELAKFGKAKL